jgi:hypothetical protein
MEASKASDRKRRQRSSASNPKIAPAKPTSESVSGIEGPPARVAGESRGQNVVIAEKSVSSRFISPNVSSTTKANVLQCEVPGCTTPVFNSAVSAKKVCKKHDVEQRHARAVAAGKASVPAPISRSKPINKKALHHLRPADKEAVDDFKKKEASKDKEVLKRKRAEISKGNSASNAGDMRPRSSGTLKPASGLPGPLYTSGHVTSGPTARRPSIEETQVLNKPQSIASQSMVGTSTRKQNLSTAFTFQSPYPNKLPAATPIPQFTQKLSSAPHDPRLPEKHSPEYEPPPPQIPPGSRNMWGTSSEDYNRPNSNLRQGLVDESTTPRQPGRAPVISSTKKQNADMLPTTKTSGPALSASEDIHMNYDSPIDQLARERPSDSETRRTEVEMPFMPFPAAARTPKLPVVHLPDTDTNMMDGLNEDAQPDTEALPAIGGMSLDARPDAELSSTHDGTSPDAQHDAAQLSPTMDGPSPGTQLNKELAAVTDMPSPDAQPNVPDITGPDVDPEAALAALNDGWVIGDRPPTTLELKLARGDYNEDALDFFLARQANRDDSARPTMAQVQAQNWGYLDPKVAWPEEPFTDEQAAAKIKQIEARGGRKAQFGKVFTAQNLQERAEKGLPLHRWQEKRNDESTKALVKRMEDLFGMENLANLVPATRNGRLVMMEQEEPEEELRGPGRRKKKNPPKIYPVHGAPNSM